MTDVTNLAAGVRAFTSNAFLVSGERTVLVDAGTGFDVVTPLRERVDGLDALVLTHTHRDHVGNVDAVREAVGVETWGFDPDHPAVDRGLDDGMSIRLGDDAYRVHHTPGHKDDHVCLYAPETGVCFVGDLVFEGGSFGRTDLEEGDRDLLIRSIETLLATCDLLTTLHPGHGPSVTDGAEATVERALAAARVR
jgi:glyoxylase-like metal-dependent hydrolase (beta-lactamase superfamily II)